MNDEQREKFKLWLKKFTVEELNELRKLFWEEWNSRMREQDRRIKPN